MSQAQHTTAARAKPSRSGEARVLEIREAGPDHRVITTRGAGVSYRRTPCGTCPWRKDADGTFPAEAFKHSARTAEDMSEVTFSCHESGHAKAATCAGFLLRGAAHNMSVRLGYISGRYQNDVADGGLDLHESYRAMAEANGVAPDDPALARCRS